jgi:hypothetical protein
MHAIKVFQQAVSMSTVLERVFGRSCGFQLKNRQARWLQRDEQNPR